jgi:GNAT superfamily N-acetyltransferase
MIEESKLGNVDEILEVINASNRAAYYRIIPGEHFRDPVTTKEELLGDLQRMTFYSYRYEEKIVGVVALHIEGEKMGRIRYMYVLPACQRRGIGSALMRHAEGKARHKGLKRIRLRTVANATWAIDFYRKLGYRMAERIEAPSGADVFMEKELG